MAILRCSEGKEVQEIHIMIFILIFMFLVVVYQGVIKKDWTHPIIYFFGIWSVCVLLNIIDLYDTKIPISHRAILIIGIGVLFYWFGTLIPFSFSFRKGKRKTNNSDFTYSMPLIYMSLVISLLFNLFMGVTTISFLRSGYAYSQIRDLLFSYGDTGTSYFANTFLSTFNSWISSPCTYIIASVFVLDFFEHRFKPWLRIVMVFDIGLSAFSTGGRLMLFLMVVQIFPLLKYYRTSVSKKYIKRIVRIGLLIIVGMVLITVMRRKEIVDYAKKEVNSIYAYFSINIPLLSYWVDRSIDINFYSYGIAFINGIIQPIYFVLRRLGITSGLNLTDFYLKYNEIISLPQESWIHIYEGYWYNAFVSAFYYFFLDFREVGVAVESLIFGYFSQQLHKGIIKKRRKKLLLVYMICISINASSFIRWQLSTATYVVMIVLALYCMREKKSGIIQQ